ncbi:MAG: type II secretion system protein [Desulfobacterales bacterium]|nr:type II secretion system protein [Desulfobacterales bacterium]
MSGRAERTAEAGPQGFTYISALVFVVIMGIALSTAGGFWSTVAKREREQELLFRGDQILRAIDSYYRQAPGNRAPEYPKSMQDLLKDPRYPSPRRHLRRPFRNPMSREGNWELILDNRGGIKGVFANSPEQPTKKGRFPAGYEKFETAAAYSDWKFTHDLKQGQSSSPLPPGNPSAAVSPALSGAGGGKTE